MAPRFTLSSVATALLAASLTTAHFDITYPKSLDGPNLDDGPCGDATIDFTNTASITEFHVGGDAIALRPTHAEQTWLFRASTDTTAQGNWTQIFPIVMQSGLGQICEPVVAVPAEFAGKNGIISVVAKSPDGILYVCSMVKFVDGVNSATPTECKNTTSADALSFTGDDFLSTLVGAGSDSPSAPSSSSGSASGSQSAPSSTSSPSAALSTRSGLSGFAGFVATVSAAAIAGACLLL